MTRELLLQLRGCYGGKDALPAGVWTALPVMPSRRTKALALPVTVHRLAVASPPRHLPSASLRTHGHRPNPPGHLKQTGTAVALATFVFSHLAPSSTWHWRSGVASKSVVPTDCRI